MTTAQTNLTELWLEYQQTHKLELKHDLIMRYIWMIKYVLHNTNIPTNSLLDESDLLNIGILGLNEAIDRFDLNRGVKFESYAVPRIRGTIQDELRKLDWLSRSARKKAQDFLNTKDALSVKEGREVTIEEIMNKLNVTPDKYQSYLAAAAAARSYLSMSDSSTYFNDDDEEVNILEEIPEAEQDNFLNKAIDSERINILTRYLANLDEKKRLVMVLYYYEEQTFKQIGAILGISESRVCQIHSKIIIDLRKKIKEFDNA